MEGVCWELEQLLDFPDWHRDALCTEPAYAEVQFFPERGEDARPAKAVCDGCLVRAECLQTALDFGGEDGIWGGLSGRQRRQLRQSAA